MAVVTLRAFAALREVVGGSQQVEAEHVAGLLASLAEEHGEEFTRRMQRATVVVDDEPVSPGDATPLQDGAEVVLLPPFAGG